MSVRKLFTDPSDISGQISDAYSCTTTLVAFAGGGQANATALPSTYNRVTTVATAGDSVKLPAAVMGSRVVVFNQTANSTNVFPQTGQNINLLANNAAFAVPAGKGCEFFCCPDGTWNSLLGA